MMVDSHLFATLNQIQWMADCKLHGFSLGCLDAYFHLTDDLKTEHTRLVGWNKNILVMERRRKVFLFEKNSPQPTCSADYKLLRHFQESCVIYSDSALDLPKENQFKEIAYHLPAVFDPESYPTKKKRHARIKYPFTWLKNQGVEARMMPKSIEEVKQFHEEWVEHKLAQPSTYKIMFPRKRYMHCVERWHAEKSNETPYSLPYRAWFFYMDDKLVSVRVVSVHSGWAYDLANFTNTWDCPSQLSNYCDIYALRDLHNDGIVNFNCGAVLNKGLQSFKAHYPHTFVVSLSYSKNKPEQKPTTCQQSFF